MSGCGHLVDWLRRGRDAVRLTPSSTLRNEEVAQPGDTEWLSGRVSCVTRNSIRGMLLWRVGEYGVVILM